MTGTFKTTGVCSTEITYKVENDVVRDVVFISGCPCNLQGISRLLKGIKCGRKDTPCPDQLAHALEEALGTNP